MGTDIGSTAGAMSRFMADPHLGDLHKVIWNSTLRFQEDARKLFSTNSSPIFLLLPCSIRKEEIMTENDVKSILGPGTDPTLLSDILRTGADASELACAKAWVEADEAQVDAHSPFPSGRVARLVELLEADQEEDDLQ
jgi:hypothetical protein|tara:strand:- start:31 stop:444 length:414 start_codon:yes stop_codon:yes gene_type:complete